VIDAASSPPLRPFEALEKQPVVARITLQDGFVFQAAVVTVAQKRLCWWGLVAVNICFSLSVRSCANLQRFPLGSSSKNPQRPPGLRFLAESPEGFRDRSNRLTSGGASAAT